MIDIQALLDDEQELSREVERLKAERSVAFALLNEAYHFHLGVENDWRERVEKIGAWEARPDA